MIKGLKVFFSIAFPCKETGQFNQLSTCNILLVPMLSRRSVIYKGR
jgi:hypothetical protein